jgi:hypothetical protein
MSNLVEHAKRELALLGEEPEMTACLVKSVEGFASYPGHSGGSAAIAREMLHTLLDFGNLAALTDDPAEWADRSEVSSSPLWQNIRNPKAMSEDGGQTYWLVGQDSRESRHAAQNPAVSAPCPAARAPSAS